ncbi:Effector protein HopAB2 [Pseudomonas caricapapayae]|uniref:Effector protein HopAB2 n=2 Tax=Pseudomonas caricapapayae TaxID=46678 RepID=A0A3M6FCA6_9PSED|nr:Effector protein HopAB2 [Pseudomonas caricapapayae]
MGDLARIQKTGEDQHMVGINRAGPSGDYFGGHTDPEPTSGRARGSSSGASSSNSPQAPSTSSSAPTSQAQDRRERLLRSRPLSRETREWLEQGMPQTAEPEGRDRSRASADEAAPRAGAETRRTPQAPANPAGNAPAPRVGAVAHANSIVQQLISAGADLSHTRIMFRNAMNGDGVAFSRAEQRILLEHFPDMLAHGINRHTELAREFRGALHREVRRQEAASAPARTPERSPARPPASPIATESTSGSSQRSLFGRFARLMAPNQAGSSSASSASTSRVRVDRSPPRVNQVPTRPDRAAMRNRGNSEADAALQGLARQGINMERLSAALGRHIMSRRPIPPDMARALQSVGISPSIDSAESLVENPLLNLNIALSRMLGPRAEGTPAPRPAIPVPAPTAARRPGSTRDATLRVMPEREDHESNVAYGMRLLNLNPGVGVRSVVAAFITDPAARATVVADIRAARDPILSQFSQLRTISKADAESQNPGFKDAADHHPDDATQCLFGEPLSLTDADQQVIGLASHSTETSEPYSQTKNKDLVFMDMKKLAQFLAGKPRHPMNRDRLDADTIAKYAFRVVP